MSLQGFRCNVLVLKVAFFNNYLLDSKRPQLPEHPGTKQPGSSGTTTGQRDSLLGPGNAFQAIPQMLAYNQPRPPLLYGGKFFNLLFLHYYSYGH